jgi:hypothetical protein
MCERNSVFIARIPDRKSYQLVFMYNHMQEFDKFSYTGRGSKLNQDLLAFYRRSFKDKAMLFLYHRSFLKYVT